MKTEFTLFLMLCLAILSSCNQARVTVTPANLGNVPTPPTTTPPTPPTPYVTLPTISDANIAENGSTQFAFTIDSNLDGLTCSSSHISASSSNLTLVPLSNVTYSGTFPNCQVTVTPASGQTGTASIDLTVTDDDNTESATVSFDLTVIPNSAPALVLQDKLFIEGYNWDIFFDPGDADFLDKHTWSATGLPAFATLDPNTGNISVNPQPGDSGTYAVSLTVTDNKGASDTKTFNIIVEAGGGTQVPVYYGDHPAWLSAASDYAYWLYRPAAYLNQPTEKFCAIIFFHGLGERGVGDATPAGLSILTDTGQNWPPSIIDRGKHFPCLVFSPQATIAPAPNIYAWNGSGKVTPFIDHVLNEYPNVDPDRLYLTGLSFGGKGVTDYTGIKGDWIAATVSAATSNPEILNYPQNYIRHEKNFWAFHTTDDSPHYPNFKLYMDPLMAIFSPSVPSGTALEDNYPADGDYTGTFSEINGWNWVSGESTNIDATLSNDIVTLYQSGGHGNSWNRGYVNDTMWDWLIKQNLDSGIRFSDVTMSDAVVTTGASTLVTLTANIKDLNGSITQVSLDLSQVGGDSREVLVSDGNFGYTRSFTVPTGLSTGTKEIVLRARDDQGNLKLFPLKLNVVNSILPSGGVYDTALVNILADASTDVPGWNNLKKANGNFSNNRDTIGKYTPELSFASGDESRIALRWLTQLQAGNPGANGPVTGDDSGVVPDGVLKDFIDFGSGFDFTFNIEHLNAGLVYNISFVSNTANAGRSTQFEVNGVTQDIVSSNNTSSLATFTNVIPSMDGKIEVVVRSAVNRGYINGIIIEAVQP